MYKKKKSSNLRISLCAIALPRVGEVDFHIWLWWQGPARRVDTADIQVH